MDNRLIGIALVSALTGGILTVAIRDALDVRLAQGAPPTQTSPATQEPLRPSQRPPTEHEQLLKLINELKGALATANAAVAEANATLKQIHSGQLLLLKDSGESIVRVRTIYDEVTGSDVPMFKTKKMTLKELVYSACANAAGFAHFPC